MTREEFIESLEKAGFFNERVYLDPKEESFPLPDYGDLITRAEYSEWGCYFYDTCYASDGKVYWRIDPEFKECSHVLCLSK